MKKVLILVVALLAVPAMAAPVTITCANVDTVVTVSYTADSNLIRGFGMDITVDSGASITDVTVLDSNYRIYPGQIVVVDGNVVDYSTPYVAGSVPAATVTVEMASLYTDDVNYVTDPNYGYGMEPSAGGPHPLLTFTVSDDCNYTVSGNAARGGIVMENPDEDPNAGSPYCAGQAGPPAECLKSSATEYAEWLAWGSPDCWCYRRQCRGDGDGIKSGPFWVAVPDLNRFRLAFNKIDAALPPGPTGGICEDYDHIKSGPFRVAVPDLNTFRAYFNKIETLVPECDPTDINFWTN